MEDFLAAVNTPEAEGQEAARRYITDLTVGEESWLRVNASKFSLQKMLNL